MRLSFDASAVPARPVGAGRYTLALADALARRDDVTLDVWTRRRDGDRWRTLLDGAIGAGNRPGPGHRVRADVPDARPARLAWEQLRFARRLARSDADLHHAPHYTMPERTRLPVVVTVHDLTFFDHPEWHERVKVPVFRRAITVAARRASALVCVSGRTADRLRQRVDVAGEVFVVPHGVDHDRFRPEQGADDEALLVAAGVRAPYVLFVGTIEPRKSVPELVRAFARIAPARRGLSLVLAGGEGWGSTSAREAAAASGVSESVVWTGYVPDRTVPALLRGAAVVAYPAREEGFGLPALEAIACGAPVVTTRNSVMADVTGDAALLADAGDEVSLAGALEAALDAGPEAEARRRRGFEIAARYTWARSAEGHMAAYAHAVATAGGR